MQDEQTLINSGNFIISNTSKHDSNPAPHNHHLCELRYNSRGTCRQVFETTDVILESGDFIIIPPMCYHYTETESKLPIRYYGISFSIKAPSQKSVYAQQAFKKAKKLFDTACKLHDENGLIFKYLDAINHEISSKKLGYITAIKGYVSLIFTELFRLLDSDLTVIFPDDVIKLHARDYMKYRRVF